MAFSYVDTPGDGSTVAFAVSFPYLIADDVKVSVDGVGTAYTWANPQLLNVTPAPAAGKVVRVYRDTKKVQRLVDFEDDSIVDEALLDEMNLQLFYIAQETLDFAEREADDTAELVAAIQAVADEAKATADATLGSAADAVATANTAKATADTSKATADTAKATADTAIATANTAKSTADTAKATADGIDAKATSALSTANTAKSTADGIDAKATTALATANAAKTAADSAKATAEGIDAKATSALSTANTAQSQVNTAVTDAAAAKATAEGVDAKATQAKSDAATALSAANGVDAKATSALATANTAKSTADAAASTATSKVSPPPVNGKTYNYKDGAWVEVVQTGAGRFFGELVQLPSRTSSPTGVVKADGQWVTNATALYPAVVADLQSGSPTVPVVASATWDADPLARVAWVWDAANDRFRVPDWNGMQAGSIGPLMFRGDGTLGFAPGKARNDQMQNITGVFAISDSVGITNGSGLTGPFTTGPKSSGNRATFTATAGSDILFDASRVVRTGTETFGKHGVGVWGVVLFGSVSNAGAADAGALATSYANQQAAITSLQTKRRTYAAGAPASIVGLNSITIDGIPSWVTKITIILKDHAAPTGAQAIRLRTAAGAVTTGYKGTLINHAASSLAGFLTQTDAWFLTPTNVGAPGHGVITLIKTDPVPGSGGWVMEFNGCADAAINVYDARGAVAVGSDVTGIDMYRFTAGQNWTAGTVSVTWE